MDCSPLRVAGTGSGSVLTDFTSWLTKSYERDCPFCSARFWLRWNGRSDQTPVKSGVLLEELIRSCGRQVFYIDDNKFSIVGTAAVYRVPDTWPGCLETPPTYPTSVYEVAGR